MSRNVLFNKALNKMPPFSSVSAYSTEKTVFQKHMAYLVSSYNWCGTVRYFTKLCSAQNFGRKQTRSFSCCYCVYTAENDQNLPIIRGKYML